jgi:2-oxoglutarate dehydrogenase E1 component
MKETLASFGKKAKFVWVQDEPKNMGAWGFVAVRWSELAGEGAALPRCASRAESASPATGSHGAHQIEQKMLLDDAFG